MQKRLREKKTTGKPFQNLRDYAPVEGELVLLVGPLQSKNFRVGGEAFIGYFGGYVERTRFNLRFAHGLDVPQCFFDNDEAYASSERAPEFTLSSLFSVSSENNYFPTRAKRFYVGTKFVKRALKENKELRALVYPSFSKS